MPRPAKPPAHLFTAAVEGGLHPPPGLLDVAPFHEREVMGVLQCHLEAAVLHALQSLHVAVRHATLPRERWHQP